MAFQPIKNCSQAGEMTYRTPIRKTARFDRELCLRFTEGLLKRAGIHGGDRCMIEVDAEEGLGRIYNNTQLGWLLKPTDPGRAVYHLRLAWLPDVGFPVTDRQRTLVILQAENGEIIFKMPTEGGAS